MHLSRVVEYVFFFGLLGLAGYMVWQITAPFITALALAAVIVTICQPLYEAIRKRVPRKNKTIAAFLSTLVVLVVIIVPLVLITSLIVNEVLVFYEDFDNGNMSIQSSIVSLETTVRTVVPDFNVDLNKQVKASAEWVTGNIGQIFAGTVSVIFIFFISLIGSFYFFRDGRELLDLVIKASPLPDNEDKIIFERMAKAIRAVATGTLFVAMIQGTLVAIGFTIFGVDRAILFGSIASVGALIPGIGTTIVTAPAIIYLFYTGEMVSGIGLLIWSALLVGLVDNLVGPYLISRGNNLHPFIILISVLGGISLFGPVGFVIGPVIVTLFIVLLEIYNQYIVREQPLSETDDI